MCAALLAVSLIIPLPVRAASSYYVSTSGNDTNAGTLAKPFRTIQKGVSKLAAGDTLYLRGGTYAERVNISKSNITIAGYPGETAVINGTGLTGSGWVWLFDVTGNHNTFQDFEMIWPNGQGIWLEYSATNTTIRNLNIHNMYEVGINVWGNNTLIENSRVWDTNRSNYPAGANGDWSAAISIGDQNAGHGNYGQSQQSGITPSIRTTVKASCIPMWIMA